MSRCVAGLVEGRWSDELRDYPGGTDPEAWVSTRDLFNEWKRTGRAAKYAQCYIFGAIQNSMMRALGIATRQLSAFDARIDESATAVCEWNGTGPTRLGSC
jgi:hypothetical protein